MSLPYGVDVHKSYEIESEVHSCKHFEYISTPKSGI